ncbi:Fe(3+) ABC transporter substrate-binding protein [Affinibrenneria salicis]|uniref:Fe(3+) ABC transporter substrate-binding protein n=1 Tax=Affinibrenneria salicis TaxID=2590031 RepID=A0A5J5FQT6_9GAMM|nr:Fe(3+) ABC transporter substrate-binding protein [Affinibrenneria salicis]KAA8995480.1 Fe(3+) ABC transporter substrate-binding protein [Affinibrenneria salicis]
MLRKSLTCSLLFSAITLAGAAHAAGEVNIYSYRQPYLIEPMLKAFSEQSGIKTNVIYADKGLVERLKREGALSPADVVLTVDIHRVMEVVDASLAQPLQDGMLEQRIPAQYRDSQGRWFGLTLRARAVYSAKARNGKLPASFDYIDLADVKYKGRICTRSFKNDYNVSLTAALLAHHGEEKTRAWLQGLKANLAQKPQGGDRDQIKAVAEGVCDLALGNSYYLGRMLADEKQRPTAQAVEMNFPGQESLGTHVNISGVVLAKHAPNRDNAIKLIQFLSDDPAQQMYAEVNSEYPVKPGVQRSAVVASWGEFKADTLPLEKVAENYQQALKLIDEVKFDL